MLMPIFNGAPIVVVLAVFVALAAYLRQIAIAAQELLDKLRWDQEQAPLPWNRANSVSRELKIRLQEKMRHGLMILTQILFVLMFFVALRTLLWALEPFGALNHHIFQIALYVYDLAISGSLVVLVSTMWVMHTRNRKIDDAIRVKIEEKRTGF